MALLSIVLPAYNEEQNIANTTAVLTGVLEENKIEYELIFISDGSVDGTFDAIQREAEKNPRIKGAEFSRNFGKEAGIFAGLELTTGDAVIVMDCDLQHPPEKIPEMYRLWQGGAKVVEGRKSSRGAESLAYGLLSRVFYGLIQTASKIDMRDASDFKLIDRRVIDAILALPERITFFRALSGWVGFESATVYYDVAERRSGKRRWTTGKLIGYAIRNLTSFTGIPLYISTVMGIIVILASLVLLVLSVCGVNLGSFSPAVIVLMLIGGVILECLGMSSYYVNRIYEEVKHRPRYIVSRTTED